MVDRRSRHRTLVLPCRRFRGDVTLPGYRARRRPRIQYPRSSEEGTKEGRTSGDRDEGVADGLQLLLHADASAPIALTALGTADLGGRRAALDGAAVPDHLHVLGIGEGLTEVAIEVGAIARHDEDLGGHGVETVSPLQIIGHLGGRAERARIDRINGGAGAGSDVGAVGVPPADHQPRELAAVALEQNDFQRGRVESELTSKGYWLVSPPAARKP